MSEHISSLSESPEAFEFCLNCKCISCRNGICVPFKEKFMKPASKGRGSKKIIEHNGERHTVKEWSEITGLSVDTIYNRINHGKKGDRLFVPPKRIKT